MMLGGVREGKGFRLSCRSDKRERNLPSGGYVVAHAETDRHTVGRVAGRWMTAADVGSVFFS